MEKELKKIKFYKWGQKQNNDWDNRTRFIYKIETYKKLMSECKDRFGDDEAITNYAICRFYNFNCHNQVEKIFLEYPTIKKEKNKKHSTKDFYIGGESFDLKLSVYPKRLIGKGKTKEDLAIWLYKNQSKQQRHHLKNRIFVVVLNNIDYNLNWEVKREFGLIRKEIKKFMKAPKFISCGGAKCAVILVVKEK